MADLKKKEVSRSRMAEFPAGTPLRSGDEFPTEDIICEALENKSFERLNNCKRRLSTVWQILIFLRG